MSMARWSSIWHQVNECLKLNPKTVLEIGPGRGAFKAIMARYGVSVETVDVDQALQPDHVANCMDLPFADGSYDVVCAFQMLEHLMFDESLVAFTELTRTCRSHVLISLPNANKMWRNTLYLPRIGAIDVLIPKPRLRAPEHIFDGEHYWEIGKRGYDFSSVMNRFCEVGDVRLEKNFRPLENPYHHFALFSKRA